MRIAQATLEAASQAAWEALIAKGDAKKAWVLIKRTDIIEAHKKRIGAIFEADFDFLKSIKLATNRHFAPEDFPDSAIQFHRDLIQYLKDWYKKYHG